MVDLKSLTMAEMKEFVLSLGEKPFRAKQIFKWVYRGADISDMTDLSKDLREKLLKNAYIENIEIEEGDYVKMIRPKYYKRKNNN